MAFLDGKTDEEKKKFRDTMQSFLIRRFDRLDRLRAELDKDIKREIESYNGQDKKIDALPDYAEKIKLNTSYSQVQTIKARMNRN
ncbi:hypothetical protein LCGC14_2807170, partial [marine sediment metagenome]